ncbi:MAG: hypothetical protein B7X86_15655 [Sphingobacteriales bacterium 17-39-43]|uniref:hypothetical protein n=1 Tax=Daejeonella sp. TaxID=2805397 RepID=UPI000BD6E363|nr:hypothetical protein [Daejeonella sp.]OYZ28633.1 MAG: hypothetical protein B7Y24_16525 [Sphingobacteriales bacterium 16-39-50]OZA22444.1 MAG: hypothetical protein B7X86_15655 [Sphingobacteriales bacterium 17-39-43]HQT24751.1 hypothetical protein [Daejeonella sp.]HQT57827.1 hypothetical protein [Daejeonella sp.]
MKAVKLILNNPEESIQYVWKYLDLHRFIYLLTEEKLFFTRLDKFEDPIEGVPTKLLRRNNKYSNIPLEVSDFVDTTPISEREKLINEKKLNDYLLKSETEENQQRQYVNCWFAGNRESMAMWNIYSNPDSVAIKANFTILKEGLTTSLQKFILKHGRRLSIIGDKITYLPLNPFDTNLEKQHINFSGLKKDESFGYENEYRFLISTIKNLDRKEPFYAVPVDINSLGLTIVTHPSMEEWKFKNIKNLIALTNKSITLEKSPIILRNTKI